MFTVKQVSHKNLLLGHIHVYNSMVSCKICPNLGASIQQLSFNNIDIIEGIPISEEGLKSYAKGYQASILFPFVGRVQNGTYTYKNRLYELETNETTRLNALHGLVHNKFFTLDDCDISHSKAAIMLSYLSNGLKGFPFKFKLQITYKISNKGVKIVFTITNKDTQTFPFGCGWHPYFKAPHLASSMVSFASHKKLVCNKNSIPFKTISNKGPATFQINNKWFDDTFILLKNQVHFKTKNYEAQMNFNTTPNGYLQMYTPKHRESIAIEPLTCAPNAFNSKDGLLELNPNEHFNWTIDLKVKTNA